MNSKVGLTNDTTDAEQDINVTGTWPNSWPWMKEISNNLQRKKQKSQHHEQYS